MPAKSNKLQKIGKLLFKYIKIIAFCFNLVAIGVLFLSTRAWDLMPSQAYFTAYLGLLFPFILFANIVFLIAWIILYKWKFAIVQVIALLLMWTPISTYFPLHIGDNVPDASFKVLSYNVRAFNWLMGDTARVNPMFDYILQQNADIICFQEFVATEKKTKNGLISVEEVDKILKDYPYRASVKLGHKKSKHLSGLVCYSKFPIEKTYQLPFPASTYNGSAVHRLNIKGKTVTLINNHLESNRITAEDKKLYTQFLENKDKDTFEQVTHNIHDRLGVAFRYREVQAQIIRTYLEKENADASLVVGDFNDTPISYAYHKIKGDMIDAHANSGFGPGITYNENMFLFRIDFILHSANIESYNSTVGNKKYSDHYPISTSLQFVEEVEE